MRIRIGMRMTLNTDYILISQLLINFLLLLFLLLTDGFEHWQPPLLLISGCIAHPLSPDDLIPQQPSRYLLLLINTKENIPQIGFIDQISMQILAFVAIRTYTVIEVVLTWFLFEVI